MQQLHCAIILLTIYSATVAAGSIGGYHYEKPVASLTLLEGSSNVAHDHNFGPLPTVQPLPPVPALPPLPTGRSRGQYVQTQTIYQTHPLTSSIGKIAQQYQPAGLQSQLLGRQSTATSVKSVPTGSAFSSGPALNLGSNIPNPPPPQVQPLRVPFGKQAVIGVPSGSGGSNFNPNGRQLHQYAVIEIIDNDIEQSTPPYVNEPFFESYRAHGGATGSGGATPPPLGSRLLGSRSSDVFLGQQRSLPATDAVALGSGGLGFIRLANGNVYLGSGSLGYVSGQQHTQDINEARTRTGAPQPDALHFGHGPLGAPARFNRFSYRFK